MLVTGFLLIRLGSFTQEQETLSDTPLFLQMTLTKSYLLILSMYQDWKLPKLPSIVEWINKSRYIYTTESCTAIRINDIPLHTATSMTITNNVEQEKTSQRMHIV